MAEDTKIVLSSNKKIAKNTIMLYIRHILIMLVSLYTVRVILNTLGIEDYGIYNVVGGIVAMFSFFNTTMASASQRFFSFALGLKDYEKLKKTFAVNWIIYLLIAILALVLLESLGLWFVSTKLTIPPDRIQAALWVYHFSVLAFICSILTTPFTAMIIAHEDMNIYAYVSIVEALLKLAIVYILLISSCDKLQLYGILFFISTLITSLIYVVISKIKYRGCTFSFVWDRCIFKEVFSFTGWSVFGSMTVVLRNHAVTILLNQMCNPIVVAARAIAMQVSNHVNVFSTNFNTGLYPPIVKNYAAGDRKQMLSLVFGGSKITYFLMFLFTLPLLLEMPYVLKLWLKNPPEGAIIFTRLALIDALITSVSLPLMTTVRATGKVKLYELSLGSILIISFLVSWAILYMGIEPYYVMIVAIIATSLMLILRLLLLKKILEFPIFEYFQKVIFPILLMSIVASFLSFGVSSILPDKFIYICISVLFSMFVTCLSTFLIVFDISDRDRVKDAIKNKIKKNTNELN